MHPTLPDRWWKYVPESHRWWVSSTEFIVDHGGIGLMMLKPDGRGYKRIWLPPFHPYAQQGYRGPRGHGWQWLHRYLVMRKLRRRLKSYEHVHHLNGDKGCLDASQLVVMEAAEHDRYHYGQRISCGAHVITCPECNGNGCSECRHTGVTTTSLADQGGGEDGRSRDARAGYSEEKKPEDPVKNIVATPRLRPRL